MLLLSVERDQALKLGMSPDRPQAFDGPRAVLGALEAEAPGQTPELRQSEVLIRAKALPSSR